ncbi:MAG: VCBS repeat-containing protein, partial [Planctomycetota bacterium]|nr:VCBS repeat-containing protein [Planctomycetota bacterium]
MIRTKRALLCLVPVLACHHVSDDTAGGGPVAGFPPVLGGFARFQDLDLDGLASPGDQVILPFSGPVTVNTSDVSVLFLPILQDTFGAGATIVDGPAANELTVVLGSGARLRSRGRFVGTTSIGSPSSLAINPKLPPNLIEDPVGGFDAQGGDPIDLWPQHVPGIQSGLKAMADTIEAADLNRDGIGDLITTSYGTGVLLYEGLESGGYTSLLIDPATALRALPVDLFGAGRTDLVVQEDTALTVVRNLSPAGGPIEVTIDASYPLTDNFAALAHWDVDHDGDRDVVCAGELGLWVYENEGGTLLVPTAPLVSSPGGGRDLAVADTNNDGWEDVLVALDGQNVLMRPIPCVGFQLVAQGTGTSTRVELVDLNGDGRIDAVSAGEDVIEVWYGADGGIFEPAYDLPAEFILELEVLDVDGDTVPELLVNDGLLTRVFADAGAGVLEDIGLGLETGASTSIDVFDLDGDGDDDLLVVSGGMPQIWDGSLAGTWGTPRHRESLTDVGAGPVFAAVTGDLDGDGNLDLVFGRDLRLELRMGAGDGTFGAPTLLPLPEGRAHDAALGDVDGDGDLDLFVGARVVP